MGLPINMADAVGGASQANGHSNGTPSSYAAKHNIPSHFIGGNELSQAQPSKVKDFVAAQDGHTVITSVSLFRTDNRRNNTRADSKSIGSHCQQRYCCRQRDQICTKMGLRDLWRRKGHPIYRHGHTRRSGSQCRLYQDGRSVCRGA